MSILGRQ